MAQKKDSIKQTIKDAIKEVGVPTQYLGCQYLEDAVSLAMEEGEVYGKLTKSIYPTIAKKYNKRPSAIERNIRTVINQSWYKTDRNVFNKVLGANNMSAWRSPTALEFIAALKAYVLDKTQSSIFSESGISSEGFSNEMPQVDETGME